MRFADVAVALILAVVFAAIFGAFFDFAPLLAKALVRRAALWWHSDLDSPETLAEEWQAVVEERPAGTLKVVTGLGFLARATVRHGQFVSQPLRERGERLLRRWSGFGRRALERASSRLHSARLHAARVYPWEMLAIAVFLASAILGQWVIMLVAGGVACTSRFYTEVEKWLLVVAVPVCTALEYTVGFWLHYLGAMPTTTADLLAQATSYFGTLPRIAGLEAALFLSWRLARGISRQL